VSEDELWISGVEPLPFVLSVWCLVFYTSQHNFVCNIFGKLQTLRNESDTYLPKITGYVDFNNITK